MSAVLHMESSESLPGRYQSVRRQSLDLCAPLEPEDCQIQPMDDASPPKWHLAHTTWFFETFLLKPYLTSYEVFHPAFEALFNSYYNGVGQPFKRAHRGFLSRPTLEEVFAYRAHVDAGMQQLMESTSDEQVRFRIVLGLNHEQQHQELILTDVKYNLGHNPLKPAYLQNVTNSAIPAQSGWISYEGGLKEIGAQTDEGFVFDNETPRHSVFLEPYALSNRLVTNGEFIEFIQDDGYQRADLWLSDGWSHLSDQAPVNARLPLYWREDAGTFVHYTLAGERDVNPDEPVCHISAYEADAFARWKGCRLPLEPEWENAASRQPVEGNFVESGAYHPGFQQNGDGSQEIGEGQLAGLFGDVWEWTATSYGPYPGYQTFVGALGEYNGKFMANQLVLRGGSCASAIDHVRSTYRNFFYPPDRWQFSGIRLARNL